MVFGPYINMWAHRDDSASHFHGIFKTTRIAMTIQKPTNEKIALDFFFKYKILCPYLIFQVFRTFYLFLFYVYECFP